VSTKDQHKSSKALSLKEEFALLLHACSLDDTDTRMPGLAAGSNAAMILAQNLVCFVPEE
jgi:hypothetical protein